MHELETIYIHCIHEWVVRLPLQTLRERLKRLLLALVALINALDTHGTLLVIYPKSPHTAHKPLKGNNLWFLHLECLRVWCQIRAAISVKFELKPLLQSKSHIYHVGGSVGKDQWAMFNMVVLQLLQLFSDLCICTMPIRTPHTNVFSQKNQSLKHFPWSRGPQNSPFKTGMLQKQRWAHRWGWKLVLDVLRK